MNTKARRWTQEEVVYLINHYPNTSFEDMSNHLGRGEWAIKTKARGLGLKKEKYWTKEETQFLKDNYQNMTVKELMEKLGRSKDSIAKKAERMRLKKYNYYWY